MKKSFIFSTLAAVGTVSGAIVAAKATPKAVRLLEENKDASVKDKILVVAPYYIPAALIEIGTIICIYAAHGANRKQIAALSAAYTTLWNFHENYKKEVEKIAGEEVAENIWQSVLNKEALVSVEPHPSDEDELFYIEYYGDFFSRTREDVLYAEYMLNRLFAIRGYVSCNDFLELLGLEKKEGLDTIGWGQYPGQLDWGYYWIDFEHRRYQLEDGMECYDIQTPYPPTHDYI